LEINKSLLLHLVGLSVLFTYTDDAQSNTNQKIFPSRGSTPKQLKNYYINKEYTTIALLKQAQDTVTLQMTTILSILASGREPITTRFWSVY